MFDNLSERLTEIIRKTSGNDKLTEDNMQDALREVRRALLEADVNLTVVKSFISNIRERAEGEKVVQGVNPGQQFIKLVHDELVNLLGKEDAPLDLSGRPSLIMMLGLQGSGKTTLALHVIAEAQKMGGEAAFIDAEHALDPVYAKKLGVDIDNLIVSQPDTGEQALEIAEALVRSGALDIIVVDSVAALVPKAEIDGDMGDSHIGLQARLMSQALRKLAGAINKSKSVIVFINQLREKVGVMFGNPETTPGGRALKFYSSVRLDIRKIEQIKQDGEVVGNRAKVKIVKNKVAPPFREAEFDIVYGKGISKEGNILDLGVNLDIVEKSGSWFSYNGQRIAQGRENVKRYLEENPQIAKEIEEKIRDKYNEAFEKSLGEETVDEEQETEPEE